MLCNALIFLAGIVVGAIGMIAVSCVLVGNDPDGEFSFRSSHETNEADTNEF